MSTLENLRSRLEASIALREKATKGEWIACHNELANWVESNGKQIAETGTSLDARYIADAHNPYAEALLALVNEVESQPHAINCRYIPPIHRTELQDCSGIYECTCWKSRAIERAAGVLNVGLSDGSK